MRRFAGFLLLGSQLAFAADAQNGWYRGTFADPNEQNALLRVESDTVSWGSKCNKIPYSLVSQSAETVTLKLHSPNSCRIEYLVLDSANHDVITVHEYASSTDKAQDRGSSLAYVRTSKDWPPRKSQARVLKSWCNASEVVVFSCSVGGKSASVCASPDVSANSGSMVYRFGNLKKPPELAFPQGDTKPSDDFRYALRAEMRAYAMQIEFKVSEYTYTVYYDSSPGDGTSAGILVEKDGRKVSHRPCVDGTAQVRLAELYKIGEPDHEPRSLPVDH